MDKVAAYLRVSSEEQSTENQLPAIQQWCLTRGHELTEVYRENESAWRAGQQHELKRLLDDLSSGKRKYDYVIVWALDRITREGVEKIFERINTIRRYGARVVSVQEPWMEMPNDMQPLFIAMAGWIAHFQSQRKSENTKAGLARVRKYGSKSGIGIGKRGPDDKPRRKSGYLLRWARKRGEA